MSALFTTALGANLSTKAELLQTFLSPTPVDNGRFGLIMDCTTQGTLAFISERTTSGGLTLSGSVYVYQIVDDVASLLTQILPPVAQASLFFGDAIQCTPDGSRIVIGALGATVGGLTNAGLAYVYVRSGNTWILEATLQAPAPSTSARFGTAATIDASGTHVVIGARTETIGGVTLVGAAYYFTRSGGTWSFQQRLESGLTQQVAFGGFASVNEDATVLCVGARSENVNGSSQAGAAYIYTRSGVTWTFLQRVQSLAPRASGLFGGIIKFSQGGSNLFIGEQGGLNPDTAQAAGVINYFTRSDVTGLYDGQHIIFRIAGITPENCGANFAFDGQTRGVFVGVNSRENGQNSAGSLQFIKRTSQNTWSSGGQFKTTGPFGSNGGTSFGSFVTKAPYSKYLYASAVSISGTGLVSSGGVALYRTT